METRQVTQVKVYKLELNQMTSSKIEYSELAAIAYDRAELIGWIDGQVEPWRDGQWGKTYRAGSPLEWFNPPNNYDVPDHWGHGIYEEWVNVDTLSGFRNANPHIPIIETTTCSTT